MFDRIYGIYDLKAEHVIGSLVFFPADAAACRMFSEVVRAEGTDVNKYPDDYVFVCFGSMVKLDNGRMAIDPVIDPLLKPLLTGADVVKADEAARVARFTAEDAGEDLLQQTELAVS
jgi:hypothetical protein